MDTNYYIISALVFLAVVILLEAFYMFWHALHGEGSVKIQRRLRKLSAGGAHGKEALDLVRNRELSSIPLMNRWLSALPRAHAIDRMLEQAGINTSILRFTALQIIIACITLYSLVTIIDMNILLASMISLASGFILPNIYVMHRREKRQQRFAEQLPDVFDFIARSMRAGNPFSASLKAVSEEMAEPAGHEFGTTFDEMNYGLDLEDALYNLGDRVGSEELHYFITAVLIQRSTGGNLADVLHQVASVMRERVRTRREVIIQASEMRLSANILIGLPFFVAGAVSISNPGYLGILFEEPVGRIVIGVQIVLMIIGYIVIRRMINFRI